MARLLERARTALSRRKGHSDVKETEWLRMLVREKAAHRLSLEEVEFWALEWNRRASRLPEGDVRNIVRHVFGELRQQSGTTECPQGITDLSQLEPVWDLDASLEWLVDGFIAEGSITLITSESGTGKTWLAYYLGGSVAHGSPAFGRDVKQAKVLYLDGENPLMVAKRNLTELGIPRTADLKFWGGWCSSPPPAPDHPLIVRFAHEEKGLIIYDSLVEFHTGDEMSSTETRKFMGLFRDLANLGATVIVLHHTGKAETSKEYRGSSDIKAAVDTAYLLTTVSENQGKLGRLSIRGFKGRLAPAEDLGLEFKPGQGFVEFKVPNVLLPASLPDASEIVAMILREKPGSNQKQIVRDAAKHGISKHKVEEVLTSSLVDWKPGNGREKQYHLREKPKAYSQDEDKAA